MNGKELHEHLLGRIEFALDGRTWSWLARKSGLPKSTLHTQSAVPRFSIEVLARVAVALRRDIGWFFPPEVRRENELSITSVASALKVLVEHKVIRVDRSPLRSTRSEIRTRHAD